MIALKAHGTGNDFVVLIDLDDDLDLSPTAVQALCDRRTGVGADGVIRIGAATEGGDCFMDYRNADGSIVEMCGNGVRVVAKVVSDLELIDDIRSRDMLEVDTRAGRRPVVLHRDERGLVLSVTVDMGPPSFEPSEVPIASESSRGVHVESAGDLSWDAVSMGNPHVITRVADVESAPVETVGPAVELDDMFPERTNVEFVHVVDRHTVDLRVWERGVGETQACGTGACAVVALLNDTGEVDGQVDVRLPGGTLRVVHQPGTHPSVFMTGPAEIVARLELDPAWCADRGLHL